MVIGDDVNLLSLAIAGNEQALTSLLRTHGTAVRKALQGRLESRWRTVIDIDDVMQVTYLEVFLRIKQFTPAGANSFAAWLRTLAANNLRDAIRMLSRAKRPSPANRVDAPPGGDSCVALYMLLNATTSTPSRVVARGEAQQQLEQAIATLPAVYQKVVRLYDLEGFSAAEVAEAIGRTQAAVYMLRGRAHERLREILGGDSPLLSPR